MLSWRVIPSEQEIVMRVITILTVFVGLTLAACGESTEERAATGGLIGGAAGLAVGAPIAATAVTRGGGLGILGGALMGRGWRVMDAGR